MSGKKKNTAVRMFELLGIRALKNLVMVTIGRSILKVNRREKMPSYFVADPFDGNSLKKTLKWLCFNETVHFLSILLCLFIGYFFLHRGYLSGVVILVPVIFLNIGLMLMQRMNRIRIRNLMDILGERSRNR